MPNRRKTTTLSSWLPYTIVLGFLVVLSITVGEIYAYEHGITVGQNRQVSDNFHQLTQRLKVQSFYNGYVLNSTATDKNSLFASNLTSNLRAGIVASGSGTDPVYCSRTQPRWVLVSEPDITQSVSRMTAVGYYTDGVNTSMQVLLNPATGLITSITCLTSR